MPICQRLETERQAAAALPTDSAPSVEQLMTFLADFTPAFQTAAAEIKDVDRPEGLDGEIDEFEAALDGVIASWQKASTDPAAAQAELDADGQTPETLRLEESSTAVGLDACNG